MRVMYYAYTLCVGGAETIVTEYLCQLKDRGVEVCLVEDFHTDSFLTRRLEEAGIPVYTLWKGNAAGPLGMKRKALARKLGLYRRFNKILKTFQPDVLHLHALPDHLDRLKFPGNRMLYTFHSELHRNLRMLGEGNTALLQKMSDRGMAFCALTQAGAEETKKIFRTDRVLRLPNGIHYARVCARRYSRAQLKELLGIPETGFLLGSVGRMHPVKNHERMLSVFQAVKARREDALLLLVGGDQDGRMEKLRLLAQSQGVADSVFFAGQRQDATAVAAAMDCFLLTSFSECFPLVVLEAQAQGVPVVVSQAMPEECLCAQGAARLSLEEPDEAWAAAILEHREKPRALEEFDINHVIGALQEAYERLCHG